MKTLPFLFVAAAALLGLPSCSKKATLPAPVPEHTLTIHIGADTQTKSDYAARQDFLVSSVQVFVFDQSGKMETDCYSEITPTSGTVSVNVATFTGAKTVYALLNHERLTLGRDYAIASFEGLMSDLSENSPTHLVMVGKNQIVVNEYDPNKNPSAAAQSLSIYVKRLSAMVVLDKITVDFSGTALAGATFSVGEIYLKNVVGKCHLGLSGLTAGAGSDVAPIPLSAEEHGNAANWYNPLTRQSSGAPAVTVDSETLPCPNVAGGSGNSLGRCLFAYPNKTTGDSHEESFDARRTRLVIKAHVTKEGVTPSGGVDTYYVFDLPVLAANRVYRVSNVAITMLGKDQDTSDDDLQAGKVSPVITVDGWTNADPLSYEF